MKLYKTYQNRKKEQQIISKNEEIRKNDADYLKEKTDENIVIVYEKETAMSPLIRLLKIIGQAILLLILGMGIAALAGYVVSLF